MKKRRNRDAGFQACVALEAVMGGRRVAELSAGYGAHPAMIYRKRGPDPTFLLNP